MILLLACTSAPVDTACDPNLTWATWTQGFFLTYCTACHAAESPDRHGAPLGVDFDEEAQARAAREAVLSRVLGPDASMPPGGGGPMEELALLEAWYRCE